ncbi:MAG: MATE family efflux transporter [Christensenellales bacterium]
MILRIGIPAGLQSSMFSISNVLIQSAINSFGAAAIAGNTAAASIEGFATTVSNSISQAALTFSSQNMGAEKYARVRRVLLVCLAATFVGGLTLGLLIYTFGTPLLALFNTDPAVIASGLVRVRHNMPLYVLFCMQDTFVGQLRGVGYSLLPTITSLSGICLLRVIWLYTAFAASPTLDTLYLSYPVSWAATLFALVVCYAVVVRKMPKGVNLSSFPSRLRRAEPAAFSTVTRSAAGGSVYRKRPSKRRWLFFFGNRMACEENDAETSGGSL